MEFAELFMTYEGWVARVCKTGDHANAGVVCPACLREMPLNERNRGIITLCQCPGELPTITEVKAVHGLSRAIDHGANHSATEGKYVEGGF